MSEMNMKCARNNCGGLAIYEPPSVVCDVPIIRCLICGAHEFLPARVVKPKIPPGDGPGVKEPSKVCSVCGESRQALHALDTCRKCYDKQKWQERIAKLQKQLDKLQAAA